MNRMIRFIPSVMFLAFLAWIITDANRGSSNIFFELARMFPYGDKVGHAVLFFILAGLLIVAFGKRSISCSGIRIYHGALIALGFALIEEFSQLYFPNRTFDYLDLLSGMGGIYLACLCFGNSLLQRE